MLNLKDTSVNVEIRAIVRCHVIKFSVDCIEAYYDILLVDVCVMYVFCYFIIFFGESITCIV